MTAFFKVHDPFLISGSELLNLAELSYSSMFFWGQTGNHLHFCNSWWLEVVPDYSRLLLPWEAGNGAAGCVCVCGIVKVLPSASPDFSSSFLSPPCPALMWTQTQPPHQLCQSIQASCASSSLSSSYNMENVFPVLEGRESHPVFVDFWVLSLLYFVLFYKSTSWTQKCIIL